MIIRIEALGHVLTLTLGKHQPGEPDEHPTPVSNDPPIEVYAEPITEPFGFRKRPGEARR